MCRAGLFRASAPILYACLFIFLLLPGCRSGVEIGREYTPEELGEDLAFLLKTLEEVHPDLYAYTSKEVLAAEFDRIESFITAPATRLDLYLKIAPAVALIGDGHTTVSPPQEEWLHHLEEGGRLFPFTVKIDEEGCFVDQVMVPGVNVAPGSEIVSVNGTDLESITGTLMAYVSGETLSFRRQLLQRNFHQLLWLVYGFEDEFEVEILDADAAAASVLVVGGATSRRFHLQQRRGEPYSFHVLPGVDAGMIDFRAFYDPEQFEEFIEETFALLKEEQIGNLIIDIRENGGGHSVLGDALLHYLTDQPFTQFTEIQIKISEQVKDLYRGWSQLQDMETGSIHTVTLEETEPGPNPLRFAGNVYLLISPTTFSSAASFAAVVKHLDIATLVGEETGGLIETFGDVYRASLPNTRLAVGVSHKRFTSPGDDRGGVTPHHEVGTSREDLAEGIDAAMEFVVRLIREGTE